MPATCIYYLRDARERSPRRGWLQRIHLILAFVRRLRKEEHFSSHPSTPCADRGVLGQRLQRQLEGEAWCGTSEGGALTRLAVVAEDLHSGPEGCFFSEFCLRHT